MSKIQKLQKIAQSPIHTFNESSKGSVIKKVVTQAIKNLNNAPRMISRLTTQSPLSTIKKSYYQKKAESAPTSPVRDECVDNQTNTIKESWAAVQQALKNSELLPPMKKDLEEIDLYFSKIHKKLSDHAYNDANKMQKIEFETGKQILRAKAILDYLKS